MPRPSALGLPRAFGLLGPLGLLGSLLSLGLSGCAGPVPGWHASATVPGACERHRGLLTRDADDQLRDVQHPRELMAAWSEETMGVGTLQITRGDGGWWIANKGTFNTEYGPRGGALVWLADGSTSFETLAEGRYVGVINREGEVWAIRGECPFGFGYSRGTSFAIVERVSRTGTGWAAPVEIQRYADLCPSHAIADREGRPLLIGIDTAGEYITRLVRAEGDQLRLLGLLGGEWFDSVGEQAAVSDAGDVLLSAGWWRWADHVEVDEQLLEETMPMTQVLERVDDDQFISGFLVRGCRGTPLTAESALGIEVERRRGTTTVTVLDSHRDIVNIVNYIRSLDGPVTLWIDGIDIQGRAYGLLELPEGTTLHMLDSMWLFQMRDMVLRRPDLFTAPSTWRPTDHEDHPDYATEVFEPSSE